MHISMRASKIQPRILIFFCVTMTHAWGPSCIQGDLPGKGPHGFNSFFLHFICINV